MLTHTHTHTHTGTLPQNSRIWQVFSHNHRVFCVYVRCLLATWQPCRSLAVLPWNTLRVKVKVFNHMSSLDLTWVRRGAGPGTRCPVGFFDSCRTWLINVAAPTLFPTPFPVPLKKNHSLTTCSAATIWGENSARVSNQLVSYEYFLFCLSLSLSFLSSLSRIVLHVRSMWLIVCQAKTAAWIIKPSPKITITTQISFASSSTFQPQITSSVCEIHLMKGREV